MLPFMEKGTNFLVPETHGYNGLEHSWQDTKVSLQNGTSVECINLNSIKPAFKMKYLADQRKRCKNITES